jgi:hypothetical protein
VARVSAVLYRQLEGVVLGVELGNACKGGLTVSGLRVTTLPRRARRVLIGVVVAFVAAIVGSPAAPAQSAWVVVPSPSTSSAEQNVLNGVACVSSTHCWAVGTYFNSSLGLAQTLIEEGNGTSWSIVSSPKVPGVFQELHSVACVSDTECWAVGTVYSSPPTALIERWNGTSWSIVASPDLGEGALLFDVTCASTSMCIAVGLHFDSNDLRGYPLIEHWDGVSWSVIRPPTPGGNEGVLTGVSCASRSRCWAVGGHHMGSTGATLVERWNGKSWSVVDSPNSTSASHSSLGKVTCLSNGNCWAVGSTVEAPGVNATLVERWRGGSWSIVPSANSSRAENFLGGVSCLQRSGCWAVGTTQDASGANPQALLEHWNGNSWSLVNAPTPTRALLSGITCQRGECWAVGTGSDSGQFQTLILHSGYIAATSRYDLNLWIGRPLEGATYLPR